MENRVFSMAYNSDRINYYQASGHILYCLKNAEINFNDVRERQVASTIEIKRSYRRYSLFGGVHLLIDHLHSFFLSTSFSTHIPEWLKDTSC